MPSCSSQRTLVMLLTVLLAVSLSSVIAQTCSVCGSGLTITDYAETLTITSEDGETASIPCKLFELQAELAGAASCAESTTIFQNAGSCTSCATVGTPPFNLPSPSDTCYICGTPENPAELVNSQKKGYDPMLTFEGIEPGDAQLTCSQLETFVLLSGSLGGQGGPNFPPQFCEVIKESFERNQCCSCFPEDSVVLVKGKGPTLIQDIKLGDYVAIGNDEYSQVYSFGHFDQERWGDYVKLSVESPSTRKISTIRASPIHLIFTDENKAVQAQSLKVGDTIVLETGEHGVVKKIGLEQARGMYAPFTMSGTVVVDGFVASSYTSLQGKDSVWLGGFDTGVSWHTFGHAIMSGQRLYCRYFATCEKESHASDGFSYPVSLIMRGLDALTGHPVLTYFLMCLSMFLGCVLMTVEKLGLTSLLVAFSFYMLRQRFGAERIGKKLVR